LSGAISTIWANTLAARSPSPSPGFLAHRQQRRHVLRRLLAQGAGLHRQLRQDLVEILLQLRFAARLGQVGHRLALEHRIDRGDRAHLELGGDELFLVHVHLGQDHALVGIFGGDLFQHRGQRLARAAPFRPEIEDDELGHRRFDDSLAEAVHRLLFVEVEAQACHYASPLRIGPGAARAPLAATMWESLAVRQQGHGGKSASRFRHPQPHPQAGTERENANLLLRRSPTPVIGPPHPSGMALAASH
jgi:hypothetical protein